MHWDASVGPSVGGLINPVQDSRRGRGGGSPKSAGRGKALQDCGRQGPPAPPWTKAGRVLGAQAGFPTTQKWNGAAMTRRDPRRRGFEGPARSNRSSGTPGAAPPPRPPGPAAPRPPLRTAGDRHRGAERHRSGSWQGAVELQDLGRGQGPVADLELVDLLAPRGCLGSGRGGGTRHPVVNVKSPETARLPAPLRDFTR
jgi:hypothetical protein